MYDRKNEIETLHNAQVIIQRLKTRIANNEEITASNISPYPLKNQSVEILQNQQGIWMYKIVFTINDKSFELHEILPT